MARLHESVRAELIQAFGGLPYIYDLLSTQVATQNLFQDVSALLQERTWSEAQHIIEKHPELLSSTIGVVLERLAAGLQDEEVRRIVALHQVLLERCREVGIESAFAELQAGHEWQKPHLGS